MVLPREQTGFQSGLQFQPLPIPTTHLPGPVLPPPALLRYRPPAVLREAVSRHQPAGTAGAGMPDGGASPQLHGLMAHDTACTGGGIEVLPGACPRK